MKHLLKRATLSAVLTLITVSAQGAQWKLGMTQGTVPMKSADSVAFAPDGILFVADSKSAAMHAIATGDVTSRDLSQTIRLESVDRKLAALVGVTTEEILIQDMAVNPLSGEDLCSLPDWRRASPASCLYLHSTGSVSHQVHPAGRTDCWQNSRRSGESQSPIGHGGLQQGGAQLFTHGKQ